MLREIVYGPDSPLEKSLRQGDVGQAAVTAAFLLSTLDNGEMAAEDKNKVRGPSNCTKTSS